MAAADDGGASAHWEIDLVRRVEEVFGKLCDLGILVDFGDDLIDLDLLGLTQSLLRLSVAAVDVHEQLLVRQLTQFVPRGLELIDYIELVLTIFVPIVEVFDFLLQLALDLAEEAPFLLVDEGAHLLVNLLNFIFILNSLILQLFLVVSGLDQGGADEVLQDLRFLELDGEGIALLPGCLVYRADLVVFVDA